MKKRGKRLISFIVAWTALIFSLDAQAQKTAHSAGQGLNLEPGWSVICKTIDLGYQPKNSAFSENRPQAYMDSQSAISLENAQKNLLSADFYAQNMGFFCKKEWQFEKAAGLALRFRLGSKDYCDFMEGKTFAPPQK
jgi:hypothetical protein